MDLCFSIIVCSYNPDPCIFDKVIKSLSRLSTPVNTDVEFVIVDNNSKNPLSESEALKYFLQNTRNSKCVVEKKPGLTEARKRGFLEAKYNWIVFFDDDNEPAEDFLQVLSMGLSTYPQLCCTGPGTINVEYQGKSYDPWFDKVKFRFQQRNHTEFKCSSETKHFEDFYPVGTGMVIRKDILSIYIDKVVRGIYTLSDRKGRSLASGGDLQIVFTCAELGYAIGVLPGLKLNHLIPANRTTVSYLVKQIYGTSSTCLIAYDQVFPRVIKSSTDSNSFSLFSMVLRIMYSSWKKDGAKEMQLKVAQYLGDVNAGFLLTNKERPFLLKAYEYLIRQ